MPNTPSTRRVVQPKNGLRMMTHQNISGQPSRPIRSVKRVPGKLLQRKCACGGAPGPTGECEECRKKRLSRQRATLGQPVEPLNRSSVPTIVHEALRTPGQPLDPTTREFMEPRFGHDLSRVRVHRDSRAAKSAQAVNALAYTVGQDVVFGHNQYAPATPAGLRLIAHELTHTIQQGSIGSPSAPVIADPGDPLEREAELRAEVILGPNLPLANPRSAPVNLARQADDQPVANPVANSSGATGEANELPLAANSGGSTTPLGAGADSSAPGAASTPSSTPGPLCPTVATSTPAACTARHDAYCAAAACFPGNPWLKCVCTVSGQICDAISAFGLDASTTPGRELWACLLAPPTNLGAVAATKRKGAWLLATNSCIWGHWRAALDAIHNPALPVPGALTPEWASAVSTCRSKGIGSPDCCRAHVSAEQNAIDFCGKYSSSDFGPKPTDVPNAPVCSFIVDKFAPGPPFTGDFGKVSDRISFGNSLCCS